MKRYLFTWVLVLGALASVAQYVPNSGQLFQFSSSFNPAFTGVEDFTDIKIGGRYQWSGYGAGAPKFLNLMGNIRLKQPLDFTTNGVRMSNASVLDDPAIAPRRKQIIHGLGASVFYEKYGPINRTGGGVNYAFNYPVSKKMRLAIGVSAMIDNIKMGYGDIYLGSEAVPDLYYEQLLANSSNHTELNVRGGMLLYSKRFFVGFSYLPVVTSTLKSSDVSFSDPFYKGTAQAGIVWPVNPSLTFKPSVMALLLESGDISINYNVKAYIQNKLWLGVTYLDTKSAVMLFGFDFTNSFGVSYSYEMSMDGFKTFSDGSHDLVLSIRLNNFKHQDQYTW